MEEDAPTTTDVSTDVKKVDSATESFAIHKSRAAGNHARPVIKYDQSFAEVKDAANKKSGAIWPVVFGLYAHYAQSRGAHERTGPGGSGSHSRPGSGSFHCGYSKHRPTARRPSHSHQNHCPHQFTHAQALRYAAPNSHAGSGYSSTDDICRPQSVASRHSRSQSQPVSVSQAHTHAGPHPQSAHTARSAHPLALNTT